MKKLEVLKELGYIDENGMIVKGPFKGKFAKDLMLNEDYDKKVNYLAFGYKKDIKKFAAKFNLTIKEIVNGVRDYTVYFEESFARKELSRMYDEYMKEIHDWYGKN